MWRDEAWLPDRKEKGTIVKSQGTGSYVVESESQGTYHRNPLIIWPSTCMLYRE